MMDCASDGGGLDDLVDLATDISDSVPNIRDAAERLLTLLGVDDGEEDSSSEDEGVELDVGEDEPQNARLLHQLATSLVQELKYAQRPLKHRPPPDDQMEVAHDDFPIDTFQKFPHVSYVTGRSTECGFTSNKRCRIEQEYPEDAVASGVTSSWNAGWDACTAEAVRYLLEVEGLPPHHPKVMSLKCHLEAQKQRALAQYTS